MVRRPRARGPRPGAWGRRVSDKPSARERILAAAVRQIAREGIDGVRIARIAMAAGVSTSLVHYHFDSRDALLAEALDYSYARAGDARISSGELPANSHSERLQSMIDQCLPTSEALQDDWVLWVELWLRAARNPELRPVAEELYARLHAWFAGEIAAGRRQRRVRRLRSRRGRRSGARAARRLRDQDADRRLGGSDRARPARRRRRACGEVGSGRMARRREPCSDRRAGAECGTRSGATGAHGPLHVARDPVV